MSMNKLLNIEIKGPEKNKIILTNIVKMLTNRHMILKPENLEKNIKKVLDQMNENLLFTIKSDYDESVYSFKIYYQKLTTIKKVTAIEEFILKNKKSNKILILTAINNKVNNQLLQYKNLEVFFDYEMMINLVDMNIIPDHHLLTEDEKDVYIKSYHHQTKNNFKGMSKMFVSDPVARYYNMSVGDIVRIVRPSVTSGYSVFYRRIVPGNTPLFMNVK